MQIFVGDQPRRRHEVLHPFRRGFARFHRLSTYGNMTSGRDHMFQGNRGALGGRVYVPVATPRRLGKPSLMARCAGFL
jgi:hypothetical protein